MNQLLVKQTDYLRRGIRYLGRLVEVWLFTHTPCPSHMVMKILAQENRDQTLRDRDLERRPRGGRS